MLAALLLDLDGTLLDTNGLHVEAWRLAFLDDGIPINADRIAQEIGKGGDQLVTAVLGATAEREQGEALRARQGEHFRALLLRHPPRIFPGVHDLKARLAERGIRACLTTSSSREHLEPVLERVGLSPDQLADEIVTADDAEATKPAPDLILAALRKLELAPTAVALLGDTVFDVVAARAGGVVTLGLTSGGTPCEVLRAAGARGTWAHVQALLDDLDGALRLASPGTAVLDGGALDRLMDAALEEARRGMARGEAPIGAVLARGDGTIVGRGYNAMQSSKVVTAHAEMVALADAAGRLPADARDVVMVSTLEPCVMCTGAAMETAVDTLLYALPAPQDGGTRRVRPPVSPDNQLPRMVGPWRAAEARALFAEWLDAHANPEQEPFVRALLERTADGGGTAWRGLAAEPHREAAA